MLILILAGVGAVFVYFAYMDYKLRNKYLAEREISYKKFLTRTRVCSLCKGRGREWTEEAIKAGWAWRYELDDEGGIIKKEAK